MDFDRWEAVVQDLKIANNNMRDRKQNNFTKSQIMKERVDVAVCALLNLNNVLNMNNIAQLLTQFRFFNSMITTEVRGLSSRPAAILFVKCKFSTER